MTAAWKYLVVGFLVAFVSTAGCGHTSTLGDPFNEDLTKQIKSGVSKKNDVLQMFGEPYRKDIQPGGKETWTYQYIQSKASVHPTAFIPLVGSVMAMGKTKSSSTSQSLHITFDGDIVARCQYLGSIRTSGKTSELIGGGRGTTTTTNCGDASP